jgi:hypothetical protein
VISTHIDSRTLLRCIAVLSLSIAFTFGSAALAGTIDHDGPMVGPGGMTGWMGTDVWYAGVSETNEAGAGGAAEELFGAPTGVSGNVIDFDPTFRVDVDGPDSDQLDGQLNFMVVAKPGKVIDNLQFTEAGDTGHTGIGTGGNSITSVTANFFVDVVEVDGQPLNAILNLQKDMSFVPVGANATPPDGRWELNADGDGFLFSTAFSGSLLIDINQALTDAKIDFEFGATKVNVAVDNRLSAIATAAGYSAFIAKKDFDGITVTTNVPEPTAVLLAAFGLVGIAARRR